MADFRRHGFSKQGPASRDEADATDRMYVVGEEDSLSSIARKFYGKASARRRIIEANRALIHDPYLIQPGWRLRIPA
jgi:nucleoid-associated protein YgaU